MNVPEWVVTQLAAGRIGAVLVNVNPAYRVHELPEALAMADVATLSSAVRSRARTSWRWLSRSVPEVRASSRDWSSRLLSSVEAIDRSRRTAGPGLGAIGADLEQGPLAPLVRIRVSFTAAVRPTDVHNIQFTRERPACPRGPCSHIATSS